MPRDYYYTHLKLTSVRPVARITNGGMLERVTVPTEHIAQRLESVIRPLLDNFTVALRDLAAR